MDNKYKQVLDFIAKFGTIHERHLNLLFANDLNSIEKDHASIIKTLVKEKYVNQHKIKIDSGSYYTLGKIGAEELDSKEVKELNHNNLNHDMLLLDLYFDLLRQKPDSEIKSERELKIGEGLKVGDKKKFPDLMLSDLEGKDTAIELEISVKSQDRLIEIINNYIQDSKLFAVYYFVTSQVLGRKLLNLAGNHKKLKVFLLNLNTDTINYNEILSLVADETPNKAKSRFSYDFEYYLSDESTEFLK